MCGGQRSLVAVNCKAARSSAVKVGTYECTVTIAPVRGLLAIQESTLPAAGMGPASCGRRAPEVQL